MKTEALRVMSHAELEAKLSELKAELFTLRFQLATGQLQNTMSVQDVKRDIARVKTILRAQELKAQA